MGASWQGKAVRLGRIVSGGQTGADRGALDAAIELGIAHGGWCPRGRLAEDGVIPPRYQLTETDSPEYHVRTEQNVLDSDATLILYRGEHPIGGAKSCPTEWAGGTELTRRLAQHHGKPCLAVDLDSPLEPEKVRGWIVEFHVQTLNVAGPRESQCPGISARTTEFLKGLLGEATTR